jgi:hypothetical protein
VDCQDGHSIHLPLIDLTKIHITDLGPITVDFR